METTWTKVADRSELAAKGRMVVRPGGRQIALFDQDGRVFACNNRCPHEGYPLAEGDLAPGESMGETPGDCVLTCNWHNWKFRLSDGEALMGGDAVRVYPVREVDGSIELDLADLDGAVLQAKALAGLRDSFDRHEYDRMTRELARLEAAGGDPLDGLRAAICWTAPHFEYGSTHAVPATADWLELRADHPEDSGWQLAALTEGVGHFAWDARREPRFEFPAGETPFDEAAFLAAVEAEDEAGAIAMARSALAQGCGWAELEPTLAKAALAHYQDFGHSAIYVYKTGRLIEQLGPDKVLEPLVLMMVRSLVFATREDLIPEFRAYGETLAAGDFGTLAPAADDLRQGSVKTILAALAKGIGNPLAAYDAAMTAAAWQMLHFDMKYQAHTDMAISRNVGWLSFTHALTFGNAVRKLCEAQPDLWPQGLLQMGCFLGRNAGFIDKDMDASPWFLDDLDAFYAERRAGLIDHGQFEYIVSAHLVKLTVALMEERRERADAPWHGLAAASLHRFLESPLKRKHVLRTARQSLTTIAAE